MDFTDPETGLARGIIVIVGINGAGKTSLSFSTPNKELQPHLQPKTPMAN
ncbi:MAG: hypothetical protein ACHBN1_29240 [Heteroscytonema crispum UTEX LB 1556]